MQTTTLMLDLKDHEISALLMLCRCDHRGTLAQLCDSPEQVSAMGSALDEIAWQLARIVAHRLRLSQPKQQST